MKMVRILPLLAAAALFFGGEVLADIQNEAGAYLDKNIIEGRLSNGIKVLMMDRGYAPTLALIISFRVGAADESYETAGAAHLLEHMLFKGTDKIGTKDFGKEKKILSEIESLGETLDRLRIVNPANTRIPALEERMKELQREHGKYITDDRYDKIYSINGGVGFNAGTSRDATSYYIELPASKLGLWGELESERLRCPIFREYYTERDTVYEERLMRTDSSGTATLYETFLATAFAAHPYRHPVLGWKSNIKSLSIRNVRKFYYDHYIPSRMTITVVGRQDTGETLKNLEKYFGALPGRPEPCPVAIREPEQRGEKRFTVHFDSAPHLVIGWHKPASPSRADYVCDVIENLLSDGKTSRLYKSLVLDKKIATSISAWNGFPGGRFNSLFVISGAPRPPHTVKDLEKAVYEQIEGLKKGLGPGEIRRVLNRIESSLVFNLATNMGVARYLSYYQTVMGDWKYISGYIDRVGTVTEREIRETLNTYFTEDNRTVGILVDSREKRASSGSPLPEPGTDATEGAGSIK